MKRVYIYGAGNVGRAFAAGLRKTKIAATLRAARRGLPRRKIHADLVVLAVRDGALEEVAEQLAAAGRLAPKTAVVHCAGALGPEALDPLRRSGFAVAQMHPLLSVISGSAQLEGGWAHIDGDASAVRRARALARALGMHPFTVDRLDLPLYHAAAALLANGAAALAAAACQMLVTAGCPPPQAAPALSPLLQSVACNLQRKGIPQALSGPVRRGDARAVAAHLAEIDRHDASLAALYGALVRCQLPMARQLAEATPKNFDAIEALLERR